ATLYPRSAGSVALPDRLPTLDELTPLSRSAAGEVLNEPAGASLVEELGQSGSTTKPVSKVQALGEALRESEPGLKRRRVLESRIQEHLGRVLRKPASCFDVRKAFQVLGL